MRWLSVPSQSTAMLFMWLAVGTMAATFGACYGLWLSRGCIAFMPFISDLGLHGSMKTVFTLGLLACGVFMLCVLPHIVVARQSLLSILLLHRHWHNVNIMIGVAGAATALGVGALGFFPWDKRLDVHLVCADVIFGGGLVWAVGSWVLARRFASASCGKYARHTWDSCRRRRQLQLPVAVASICVLVVANLCFVGAYLSDPAVFTTLGLRRTLELANANFGGYCSGNVGWHGMAWVNMVALSEWVYVALLAIGVVLGAADFEAHVALQQDIDAVLPTSTEDEGSKWWHFL
ncbi:unnamed protein product [Prorocentrum cordatum]|uniref:CWH43-like N-terminal domain-containing protein n=1 Tax=Prorocentrum cordatum TaxID=2364126 RepID=A0ABN9UT85_9DINO|nr:unnamed protein product [Polarella glacialis]|mmetsp:Transcript_68155/g.193329  ORF Transcript_68155/g.193329 Transcript_68155/m.193329 type:complete len:291 (-) Transcript_68155:122-994(-)